MKAIDFGINVRRLTITAITVLATAASYVQAQDESEGAVTINTAFPGGNARVTDNTGNSVHVEPDLRGGAPWFYWCFEATSTKPGKVTFVFPEKVAGFKNGAIGFQGPAISADLGRSWKWMGTDQVDGDSFSFEFAKANERVRFAVTIPYVQSELDEFLKRNSSNRHLKTSVLTKSRNGRDVELLQIGTFGPEVKAILVTGRHHAAETIASYVLEGFLQEAMSESEPAKQFREKYVLYAVPFVDKDGVEEGDQGKNRKPHDHNRDYGDESIYPEIQAIKQLSSEMNFRFALDFHCPTLVMNDHQVMYFVGPKEHPAHNFQNVSEFAGWIKRGLPENAPVGPYVWLKPATAPALMNSSYFGFKEGTIMAATLEIPFAPPGKATDPSSCLKYGQLILGAWVNTHFLEPDEKPAAKAEKPAAPEMKTSNGACRASRREPQGKGSLRASGPQGLRASGPQGLRASGPQGTPILFLRPQGRASGRGLRGHPSFSPGHGKRSRYGRASGDTHPFPQASGKGLRGKGLRGHPSFSPGHGLRGHPSF